MNRVVAGMLSAVLLAGVCGFATPSRAASPSARASTIHEVQRKIVKITGAGGLQGMEPYQSGVLVSPDGCVLTTWSYVLDTDEIMVTLDDGRRLQARLLGADPWLEVAVLKIDAAGLACFDLRQSVDVAAGTRIFALSNLFGVASGDEPVSVQHGVISVATRLSARHGVFQTPYQGPVYVLDVVTSNPGATGGAVVTYQGELVGLLGKELRNALNGTWLNYAIPIGELRESVDAIRAGKALARREEAGDKSPQAVTLEELGIVMIPDILERTPAYVDHVRPDSPAAQAGLRPDDLVVLLGDRLIPSCKALKMELDHVDRQRPVKLTVLRDQELLEYVLRVPER